MNKVLLGCCLRRGPVSQFECMAEQRCAATDANLASRFDHRVGVSSRDGNVGTCARQPTPACVFQNSNSTKKNKPSESENLLRWEETDG